MELLDEVVGVLAPTEMRVLRKELAGLTLKRLSEQTKISTAQLSQFENGRNGLRRDQVETCERVLLEAARLRSQALSKLLEVRREEMAAAS
ncbi:MAG: helix-turn-helix transcriptional regulator [Candidatus Sulfotelmatobacter sp.]